MKSPVSGCRMHVIVVTTRGYRRTGLMCYHRRVASFWRWQNKRRSLLTRLLRHGHGLMRYTQRTMGRLSGIYALLAATDLSVLGRDVLDHFDLIISRRQNESFLLTPRHQYRIERDGEEKSISTWAAG